MNTELENILVPVKEVLLDGLKFPNGRNYSREDELKKLQIATPIIISAYNVFKKSQDDGFMIFYLARTVNQKIEHESGIKALINNSTINDLQTIAKEGRISYLMVPETDEERIKSAMLYKNKSNEVFAAQLKDPKRGCSASICSNCYEPNAFSSYKCDMCNHELIQVHKMPTIEEWLNSNLETKAEMLKIGYNKMIEEIVKNRGDWRSSNSTLNRFNERYYKSMSEFASLYL